MATPPPSLPDELIEEILLRLPPDEPSCLVRASLVCKPWRRIICHRGFRRRLHELHRRPPVLGFLQNAPHLGIEGFVAGTASAFSLAVPGGRYWRALDCRHGRALLLCSEDDLVVWDPLTGDRRPVFMPDEVSLNDLPTAAVICAADGCDHRGCRGGPFRLVVVSSGRRNSDSDDEDDEECVTSAWVFSSETGTWGQPASIDDSSFYFFWKHTTSVLVGKSLLYFLSDGGKILEYDLAHCSMARISPAFEGKLGIHLILTENGGLGVAESSLDSSICLWTGDVTDHTNARWVKSRVICLHNLLPTAALSPPSLRVLGFAEGGHAVFLSTAAGVFTVELKSERVRKVCEDSDVHTLVPIVSFYTPRPTTLERAQELFDKGSEAIQKGDFVNALDFLSHAIKIRIACYGEFSPECARRYYKNICALYETQEMTDPLFNVPKSAPNEQSVKSTTCKNDNVNSKASGSNIEDSPPLQKCDFEEGQNSNGKDDDDGSSDSDYDDDNISGDETDSDIDFACEMLDIARAIVEKSPDNTVEEVEILSALAEFCLEREHVDNSLCCYLKALAILEHLVEPDHRHIVELNFRICFVLEVASKIGDAITYCAKSISLCRSRIQNLRNAWEVTLADKEDNASAAEGGSEKSTLEDEIEFLAGILAELEEKLDELEQALSPQAMSDTGTKSSSSSASSC